MRRVLLGRGVDVSIGEIWERVCDRVSSGRFGSSEDILSRCHGVELLAAKLAGAGVSGDRASWSRDAMWQRLGVAAWRKSGDAQILREWAARAHAADVTTGPRGDGEPWLWSDRPATVPLARAVRDVLSRTFDLGHDDGWQGEPVSADESEPGEALRSATTAGWLELGARATTLTETLSGHVDCVMWMDLQVQDATFRSGSTPDLPGVVLLSVQDVASPGYLARALVHEAAHCKFFDLCLVRSIVGATTDPGGAAPFSVTVPWVETTARRSASWPLDQVLAAAHSYVHLTLLAGAFEAREETASAAASRWRETFDESAARAGLLISGLEAARVGALGAAGVDFVRWLRGVLELARSVSRCASGWRGTGPVLHVPAKVRTQTHRGWDASLLGVVGGHDLLWAPPESVELMTDAGATVGDVALARLPRADGSPADALVQTMDALTPLIQAGLVALSEDVR